MHCAITKSFLRLIIMLSCALPCIAAPSISITSPSDGTSIIPGQAISIAVSGVDVGVIRIGTILAEVPFKSDGAIENTTLPYSIALTVPSFISMRSYTVRAMVVMSDGRRLMSPPIRLNVRRPDLPTSLSTDQATVRLRFVGDQAQIGVIGRYNDGTEELLRSSAGVQYFSDGSQLFSVSSDGTVTARASGIGVLRMTFAGLTTTAPIQILTSSVKGDLNGDGVVDQNDLNILLMALNQPAAGQGDARDLNGDGKIDALDLRIITTLCTRLRCAVQ